MTANQVQVNSRYPTFKEFLWYKANEKELLTKYEGRYLVIKDEKVMGDYGTQWVAWQASIKKYKPGTFIIHHCKIKPFEKLPRMINRQLYFESLGFVAI